MIFEEKMEVMCHCKKLGKLVSSMTAANRCSGWMTCQNKSPEKGGIIMGL